MSLTLSFMYPVVVEASFQQPLWLPQKNSGNSRFFDIEAHRGGRANTIENTLPSFAWALIDGATTLELDSRITKDGEVIIWHDEEIIPTKCRDTGLAFEGDRDYPYVGKYVINLTLAQIKTLDCSLRQPEYPNQLTYPGTRIPTLQELFDFLDCADRQHRILLNIESKVDLLHPERTPDIQALVKKQYEFFASSPYYGSITYQSFDWRTLIAMKKRDPNIVTSALIDDETVLATNSTGGLSPWLAGLSLSRFTGSTLGERIAQAAHAIGADILSPIATFETAADLGGSKDVEFTTSLMVAKAHQLGLKVKPWTVNRLDVADRLIKMGVDGIITDAPDVLRRWAQHLKLPVAPRYPQSSVLACLRKHNNIG